MRVIERDKEKIAHCEALMKECADLHLAAPTLLTYGIDHFDKDGNQLLKETAKSNSFVRNYYNLLSQFAILNPVDVSTYGEGSVGFKKTDGVVFGQYQIHAGWHISASYNSPFYFADALWSLSTAFVNQNIGIAVGSGDTVESFESHNLSSPILHGVGAGLLTYSAAQRGALTFDSVAKKLTHTFVRSFSNNSGAAITIKEICIRLKITNFYTGVAQDQNIMIVRDVLATPLTLADGESGVVSYAFSYIMSN